MRFWGAFVALFPLIFLQALYTRRGALRLPDAEGPQAGHYGSGDQAVSMRVAGESTTTGVGADYTHQALPAQLARALAEETDRALHWHADGVTGCRLAAVRKRLCNRPPEEDLVVIASGVNDTTGLTRLAHWRREVIDTARIAGQNGSRVIFLALPPMGSFSALPRPLRTLMGLRARALNDVLANTARQTNAFTYIDWHIPLVPDHLACDGYHPSIAGYQAMARDCARRMVAQDLV